VGNLRARRRAVGGAESDRRLAAPSTVRATRRTSAAPAARAQESCCRHQPLTGLSWQSGAPCATPRARFCVTATASSPGSTADRQRPDRGHQLPCPGCQDQGTRLPIYPHAQGHHLPDRRQARTQATHVKYQGTASGTTIRERLRRKLVRPAGKLLRCSNVSNMSKTGLGSTRCARLKYLRELTESLHRRSRPSRAILQKFSGQW
jgi:hypothetical protein